MWFIISFSLISSFTSYQLYIYYLGVDFDFGISQLSWLPPCVSAFFCDLWIFFSFCPCAPLPWAPSICSQSHGEPSFVCLRAPHLATSIVSPLCCPCTTEHVAPCSSIRIWPQRFTLRGKSLILGYARHFQSFVTPSHCIHRMVCSLFGFLFFTYSLFSFVFVLHPDLVISVVNWM